jgi:hypothetical protein
MKAPFWDLPAELKRLPRVRRCELLRIYEEAYRRFCRDGDLYSLPERGSFDGPDVSDRKLVQGWREGC